MNSFKKLACLIALTLFSAIRVHADQPLTDFWNSRGAWVPDVQKIETNFTLHFLSILPNERELSAYYINNHFAPNGNSKMGVGLARGTDGVHWTDDGVVLDVGTGTWDDRIASFPGICKDGNTWYLVYEGASEDDLRSTGDIGLATSTDGKHFTKRAEPILRHNPTDWDFTNIGTPSLIKENGIWYLFYHGYNSTTCRIGVASGKDLFNLEKSPANPVLTVSADPAAWDSGTVGKRSSIVKEGDYYYFVFEGSTPKPFRSAKWSTGLARTKKLTSKWEKFPGNPILPQTKSGMGYDGPELVRLGDATYIYVRTLGTMQSERFRLDAKAGKSKP